MSPMHVPVPYRYAGSGTREDRGRRPVAIENPCWVVFVPATVRAAPAVAARFVP